MPPQPPGYVPRGELARIIAAVTGDGGPTGLHGQGGIGKSVLAAEVARSEDVRNRFPDGVVWLTAGENPDLLALQLDLLKRFGSRGLPPRTPREATARLREVLADRRVLLVVDDVWSVSVAHAFRVTGGRGRVLYTSRDPAVLEAVDARLHRVDILSLPTARSLTAKVVDVDVRDLPPIVDHVCTELGGVALAVALVAAVARDGMPWELIVKGLDQGSRVYRDHPSANAFKAMQIAVDQLPDPLRHTLLSLAVFPADTRIPIAAIRRFWAHTIGHDDNRTRRDLDLLARANLLQLDVDADLVGFHDLQHAYLVLHAPPLADLHVSLLEAYRAMLPSAPSPQWWQLPIDEPYIGDHLVRHLRGAGDRITLGATVTDPAYLILRIAAGGPHAAETDLRNAADVVPEHSVIDWWQGWVGRHAHLLSSQTPDVVATAYAWLRADPGRLVHGIDAERLVPMLPNPHVRVRWGLRTPKTSLTRVLTGHAPPRHGRRPGRRTAPASPPRATTAQRESGTRLPVEHSSR